MKREKREQQRLTALALLGAVLLSFPILSLPQGHWFGLPALFLFIFAIWAALIVAAALMIERGGE